MRLFIAVMSRLIIFWTTCLCFASYSISSGDGHHCKTNEVHKDCGSYCTPTCATWEKRHEIFCPAVCVEGCFCIDGLIKNDDGVCVSPANCSSQKGMSKRSILCKTDEIYMECGSACPATCANRNQPRRACIAVCKPGCFCRPGLLRNSDGRCVAPSQCQRPAEGNCRADEVYRKCGSACAPTCATMWNKQRGMACPAVCVEGCFCKDGLVKDVDGSCVMPGDCKTQRACKSDEQYYDCPYSCKYNCENYKNPGIRCRCDPPGCFCKEGLVKRKDGACVKYEDCNLS